MAVIDLLRSFGALALGAVIGICFGLAQEAAWRRNKKRQDQGELENGWVAMPGSMRRVAYLLIALVAVQLLCPLFFVNGTEWWVSGGLLAGYGALLYRRLRTRNSESR